MAAIKNIPKSSKITAMMNSFPQKTFKLFNMSQKKNIQCILLGFYVIVQLK